ncbi:MAG TPA: serine protease, partial [Steroidobacteraceae bacterium]|nr:serine protease [Steroidobacteraceae bacterium]
MRLPAKLSVAIYLPAQVRRYHAPLEAAFQSGQTLEDAVLSAGQVFFSDSHIAEPGQETPFGLFLALHPQFKRDAGQFVLTMDYAVFASGDKPLLNGSEVVNLRFDPAGGDPIANGVFEATRQVMIATITNLRPDDTKYPANLDLKSRSLEFAAKTDKPWESGTGFYFNAGGQILTAAHVVEDCIKIDVKRDDKVSPAKVIARSNVIDVAVLDTGASSPAFLPFRRDLNV